MKAVEVDRKGQQRRQKHEREDQDYAFGGPGQIDERPVTDKHRKAGRRADRRRKADQRRHGGKNVEAPGDPGLWCKVGQKPLDLGPIVNSRKTKNKATAGQPFGNAAVEIPNPPNSKLDCDRQRPCGQDIAAGGPDAVIAAVLLDGFGGRFEQQVKFCFF